MANDSILQELERVAKRYPITDTPRLSAVVVWELAGFLEENVPRQRRVNHRRTLDELATVYSDATGLRLTAGEVQAAALVAGYNHAGGTAFAMSERHIAWLEHRKA